MNYIFDFDGTLISIMDINYIELKEKLQNILNTKNELKPMIEKIYELSINNSIKKKCLNLIDDYEMNAINNCKVNNKILKLYNESKYKIIISRNGFKVIDFFFKNNNINYPDIISCRDNNIKLKPDLEQLQFIYNKISDLNNTNICIVGDSWHDEKMADNANCKFLKC